jgi:hypothetical protein
MVQGKQKSGCWASVYGVPVITMLKLTVVMPLMLDDTLSVSGAAVAWPAARTTPSLSHVLFTGPLAVDGFHDVSVMLSGSWPCFSSRSLH